MIILISSRVLGCLFRFGSVQLDKQTRLTTHSYTLIHSVNHGNTIEVMVSRC